MANPKMDLAMRWFCLSSPCMDNDLFIFPLFSLLVFPGLHCPCAWYLTQCTLCTSPLTAICILLPVAEKSVMESLIQTAAELP